MPFKLLTDLYFDNKVQIIPSGAMSFFGYLYKLENIIKTPGLINLEEADLQTILFGAIFLVILITYLILYSSSRIIKILGQTGNNVMMRLMGLIVMVIAVEFFFSGLKPIILDMMK